MAWTSGKDGNNIEYDATYGKFVLHSSSNTASVNAYSIKIVNHGEKPTYWIGALVDRNEQCLVGIPLNYITDNSEYIMAVEARVR